MPPEQTTTGPPEASTAAEQGANPKRGFFRRGPSESGGANGAVPEDDRLKSGGAESSPVAEDEDDEEETASDRLSDRFAHSWRNMLRGSGACVFSMMVHAAALLALGLWMLPEETRTELAALVTELVEEKPEDELVEVKLEQSLEAATEITSAVFSSAPPVGAGGTVSGSPQTVMQLDQRVLEQVDTVTGDVTIEAPTLVIPTTKKLLDAIPEGEFKGEARAIVDNYEQAMDRITKEIMWLLDKGPVLVVWCFDQSDSMKDDQEEIRERINRVYTELGLVNRDNGDRLLTSVTSYGSTVNWNLKPTSNRDDIRAAIGSIQPDPTGKEVMCEAVGQSIRLHREYRRGGRRMMLVLVTDESGERESNVQYLELAIAEAKAQECRIYCLGRESVFGYPYAHMRWVHPQTRHVHWLPVDRGPETAFVEQYQTDGFRRRYDAFAAGFGPYEQARMARETGGIFFMLPSLESSLVRAQGNLEERRYELEALRPYRPDLRSREEAFMERDEHPLRTLLWNVVWSTNPHNPDAAKSVEVQLEFSIDPASFVRQARTNQIKAKQLIEFFGWAQKMIEEGEHLREQEPEPRWQGNYDLIYAQTVAYQARLYEYGVALEQFIAKPTIAPLTKPPDLRLVHWDIHTVQRTLTTEAQPYIDRSKALFEEVIAKHPGTPWAARAKWELSRGFGVELIPDYDGPHPSPTGPLIPVPKY